MYTDNAIWYVCGLYTTDSISDEPERKQPIGRRVMVRCCLAIALTVRLDVLKFTLTPHCTAQHSLIVLCVRCTLTALHTCCLHYHFVFQDCLSCRGFPFSVFFIVSNEFCERFSYYGMRGMCVLVAVLGPAKLFFSSQKIISYINTLADIILICKMHNSSNYMFGTIYSMLAEAFCTLGDCVPHQLKWQSSDYLFCCCLVR